MVTFPTASFTNSIKKLNFTGFFYNQFRTPLPHIASIGAKLCCLHCSTQLSSKKAISEELVRQKKNVRDLNLKSARFVGKTRVFIEVSGLSFSFLSFQWSYVYFWIIIFQCYWMVWRPSPRDIFCLNCLILDCCF